MKLLAISGSLREKSMNTMLLRTAAILSPSNIDVIEYKDLGNLPLFNPDLDNENPPIKVKELRLAIANCNAVLICSPEYAHSLPGALKNALDWLVSSGELTGKPVGLINASPNYGGAERGQAALVQVLKAIAADYADDRMIRVAGVGKKLDGDIVVDEQTKNEIETLISKLVERSLAIEEINRE